MKTRPIPRVIAVVLLLLALAGTASADTGLLRLHSAFTDGGGALSAGDYSLVGAIGQPAAGTLQAGELRLTSGVITAGAAPEETYEYLYLPLVRR